MSQKGDGDLATVLIDEGEAKTAQALPRGTIFSTSILLASSGMGAGMLTLPIAVQEAGPFLSIVLFFLGALLGVYSTVVLLIGCPRLQAFTYGSCIDRAGGFQRTLFGLPVIDTFFCLYLLCCIPSFLVFIGDFLPALGSLIPGFGWMNRTIAIFGSALLIAPFTVFNSIHLVRHIASLSTFTVLFTALVILVEAAFRIPNQTEAIAESWDRPVQFTWATLQASGNIIFAFLVGANVPAIAVEFKEPTESRCAVVALFSYAIMLVFYAAIGFGGYFSFATIGLDGDIIKNYPLHDPYMTACRAMLTVTMLSVAVLTYVPAMKSFYLCLEKLRGREVQREEYDPGFFVRIVSVSTISLISALVAFFIGHVNTFTSWLGAFFGAVELLYGPLVLLIHGHVWNFPRRARITIQLVTLLFMLYLWTAAISDCIQP